MYSHSYIHTYTHIIDEWYNTPVEIKRIKRINRLRTTLVVFLDVILLL